MELREATLVFEGNALEAAQHFPANANVAAALALAGIGPLRTRVQIWADPTISRNIHAIHVDAESARLSMTVENVPSESNPKTSKLAPLSILACLAGLVAPVRIGS
jgi:aspartate dehydrogenase